MPFLRHTSLLLMALLASVARGRSLEPVADSHVYAKFGEGWNESNWGAYAGLAAGWHPTGGECRTYLKFDLSGATLDPKGRAVLRLYHYHTGGSAAMKLGVYEVAGPWVEGTGASRTRGVGITGANQPALAQKVVAELSPGAGTDKVVDVDVTALVRGWLSGRPNHGLAIAPLGRGASESLYGFCAREHKDKAKRPALVLKAAPGSGRHVRGGGKDLDGPQPVDVTGTAAYKKVMAAYNKMAKLMAAGKGDTPDAKQAHAEYLEAKAEYEKVPPLRPKGK